MAYRLTLDDEYAIIDITLMGKLRHGGWSALGVLVSLCIVFAAQPALANTSKSQNYEATETEFGAGAALETCSGTYCARATIGQTGGDSSSESYSASFGPLSSDSEPMLELLIEPGQSNLGQLDIDRTATRTMVLNVRNHQAGGYTVQVVGSPPSFDGYSLATPIEPTASLMGTEQFALNVVANSDPEVGEDPRLVEEDRADRSIAVPKYATPNLFAYINGDVVAKSLSESSQIRYTISMIVNVSGDTPAGHFSGDFSAVVTPVF